MTEIKGIDISYHNEKIKWKNVKNIGFVIARAAYSTGKDKQFENNYNGCREMGIPMGIYQYSTALSVNDIEKEADYLIKLIKGKNFVYPIYIDMESESQKKLGKRLITDMLNKWISKIRSAGYLPGIYTNPSWLKSRIIVDELEECEFWIAHWVKKSDTAKKYNGVWQYGKSYDVEALGVVDGNISYRDYAKEFRDKIYYPKSNYTGVSIVDALKNSGIDATFSHRRQIANANGIKFYYGKANQNAALLKLFKEGLLKRE